MSESQQPAGNPQSHQNAQPSILDDAPPWARVTRAQYRHNILTGIAEWLSSRSETVWAKDGDGGLMQRWAKDLREIDAELEQMPGQPPTPYPVAPAPPRLTYWEIDDLVYENRRKEGTTYTLVALIEERLTLLAQWDRAKEQNPPARWVRGSDGSRPLMKEVLSAIHDYAASKPEQDPDEPESWESWFVAAFDLCGDRIGDIFDAHAQRYGVALEGIGRDASALTREEVEALEHLNHRQLDGSIYALAALIERRLAMRGHTHSNDPQNSESGEAEAERPREAP